MLNTMSRSAVASRSDSVCKFICEAGDWRVTNLQIQKILFVSQMIYLGLEEQRLVDLAFEAWDQGPVAPRVYRQVRMFGASPIRDVFGEARPFLPDSQRRAVLADVCQDLLPMRPGQLVAITHWKDGAWAKNYVAGDRGTPIPDADIADEYAARVRAGRLKPD